MRLEALLALYALVGLGCAGALVAARRRASPAVLGEAALLVLLWPLYGPFLLAAMANRTPATAQEGTAAGTGAGTAAGGGLEGVLARLLPEGLTAGALEGKLAQARGRLGAIDTLLTQPELAEAEAREREQALTTSGDTAGAAVVRQRLASIHRLKQLRDRFAREISYVQELSLQLRLNAEMVRLAGGDASTRELTAELAARLEAMDALVGEVGTWGSGRAS